MVHKTIDDILEGYVEKNILQEKQKQEIITNLETDFGKNIALHEYTNHNNKIWLNKYVYETISFETLNKVEEKLSEDVNSELKNSVLVSEVDVGSSVPADWIVENYSIVSDATESSEKLVSLDGTLYIIDIGDSIKIRQAGSNIRYDPNSDWSNRKKPSVKGSKVTDLSAFELRNRVQATYNDTKVRFKLS